MSVLGSKCLRPMLRMGLPTFDAYSVMILKIGFIDHFNLLILLLFLDKKERGSQQLRTSSFSY